MTRPCLATLSALFIATAQGMAAPVIATTAKPDGIRAREIADLKWGMFVCWSFSTFSEREWTPTRDKDASFFKATGCDTDQWCRTAKEAGMGYILFLTKHHDGFCLWDTATTDKKVTKSALGIDVLAKLRESCDKHGIKLALYFSEGDWNWPGAVDGKGQGGGSNPEMKKAQLKELLTNYGPIEYIWFDHAVGDGGLSHEETDKWVAQLQPDCLPGYNHGTAAGRIRLGEMGRPSPLDDPSGAGFNRDHMKGYKGYIAAEFTYPILPRHGGPGAMWFYSVPALDNSCLPARKLYQDYAGAVKCGNIFSIDVGPDFAGRLRDIDVRTLREVGKMIRDRADAGPPLKAKASASSTWSQAGYAADRACDDDEATRWGAAENSRSGWLDLDLGEERTVSHARVSEAGFDRVRKFEIQVPDGGGWKTILAGTTLGTDADLVFPVPVKARLFRLDILEAAEVPTSGQFQLFEAGRR
ncbi:MAG: alpha-L-fucosidase [Kiritimatiellia bacterium]